MKKKQNKKNKWLMVLAAIGLHISIGSVYAWSVLTRPMMDYLGCSLQEITWTFSLAILFLGMSAGFLGTYAERLGPCKSGLLATGFFTAGLLGTGYSLQLHSLPLLYVAYGCIGGIGLGLGYIAPVSTLVKWFPQRRGLATGLAIMGFGFASLVAGPLMQYLVATVGLVNNFLFLALCYGLIMTCSSLYLEPPALEEKAAPSKFTSSLPPAKAYTAKEAIRTWQFPCLWFIFFINITCGIGLLAVASPMAQEVIGMSPMAAASMVGIIGILNGGGRIFWSTVSDYLGRPNTYLAFFIIQACAFYALASTKSSLLFQLLVFLIITCYGGGFSCMPAYLSDIFGTKQLSAIHGRILTAWGMAGIAGPWVLSYLYQQSHSYSITLYYFAGAFLVSLCIGLVLRLRG